ncbi:MAG TPA: class I SAM-dependent methyltransferase [Bryobacteraceae bacterium]|nr:class I SAM-dependent methyltransferase [Bryobacteraceae bacterium]
MSRDIAEIVKDIIQIAPVLHTAGAMSPKTLTAIYSHVKQRTIRFSLETGCGASTLLMSHLSGRHLVFAEDNKSGSVENVRTSLLLNRSVVQFVEGPTQRTLPQFNFEDSAQFALLDGPHAYPFPDLEYYHVYPVLDHGALFVLDDIHIKTINNLYCFLKEDAMFRLDEVVGTTAFFTRTDAPTFCPTGDGWQSQLYNNRLLRRYDLERQVRQLLPQPARRLVKSVTRAFRSDWRIRIDKPEEGSLVGRAGVIAGRVKGNLTGHFVWVLVRRLDEAGWWPQQPGPVPVNGGEWQCVVEYGGSPQGGPWYEVAAILANASMNRYLSQRQANPASPVLADFPFRTASVADAYRRVRRDPDVN